MKIRVLAMVLFCLMVMGVQGTAAATLVVAQDGMATATNCNAFNPTPYTTIGSAVTAAGPGDTIKVCPGLYGEQVVINIDNLTLLGAQAGFDARTRATLPIDESIIDDPMGCKPVQILSNNVVFDGFTVQGADVSPFVDSTCLGAGIWTNPGFAGKQGGYRIVNNIVQDNIIGITPASGPTCPPTLVQFNLIQNNNFPGPAGGTGIYSDFGLCNATINRNKFRGHPNSSVLFFGPPVSAFAFNISVTENELVGGTPENISFLGVSSSTINGNVSIGSASFGTIDLFGGNSGVMVTSNTLFNGNRAIVVENPFSGFGIPPNSAITAHLNCIQGNFIAGMQVDPLAYPVTPQLNAENNWWGHQTGPNEFPRNTTGMGDKIIDLDQNVDFDPWLKSCPSGASAPSMVTGGGQVPVNLTGGKGTFGFNAKQDTQSGHLNYKNHVTGAHLDCTVTAVSITSNTTATFSGTCSGSATSFMARVEDNAEPGKNADKFFITYGTAVNEGGTLISGNIKIHK